MKLEFNRNPILKTFDELEVGQTFFTLSGDISIKTSHTYKSDNCMYYNTLNECWYAYFEVKDTIVEIVESTLFIDSYKGEKKK